MNQLIESLKSLGTARLAMIGVVAVMMLGGIFTLSAGGGPNRAGYAPLYSNLSQQDGSKVIAALDGLNVPYDVRGNGAQVFVPSDQVNVLKLKLAGEGLPTSGGMGYEIFDQDKAMGTSNFVYNVNLVRALEGELSRTISTFANIGSARVHIVLPKRELFSREQQEPSASVAIKLNAGGSLAAKEVEAVRYFVASAVPGLKTSKVTIVDNRGKLLAKGEEDPNNPDVAASNAEEFKIAYETRLRNTIEDLLEKSVGYGKVKAQVAAEIDFDRIVTNSESYDPDGQVVRSVQSTSEKDQAIEKGKSSDTVSVQNNLPASQGGDSGNGETSSLNEKSEETTNYEISKTVKNHVKESGTVKKLSVAILVDGNYTEDATTAEKKYTPRTEEELKKLASLVKSAIGFDAKRGDNVEVVNMQFSEGPVEVKESPMDWIKQDFSNIIQTLVLGVVAILAILLVIKPLIGQVIEASVAKAAADEKEGQLALSGPGGSPQLTDQSEGGGRSYSGEETEESLIDIDRVQGKVKSSSVRKIGELIDRNPDETLNSLRKWMKDRKSVV